MKQWHWWVWILFIAVSFGLFEGYALQTDTVTLSQTVWMSSIEFPLLPFLVGMLFGGLAVHFFWINQGPRGLK